MKRFQSVPTKKIQQILGLGPLLFVLLLIGACTFWTTPDRATPTAPAPGPQRGPAGSLEQEKLIEQVIIVTPRPTLTPLAVSAANQFPGLLSTATPTVTPTPTLTPTATFLPVRATPTTPPTRRAPPPSGRPARPIQPLPTFIAPQLPLPEPAPPPSGGGRRRDPAKPALNFIATTFSAQENVTGLVSATITVTLSFPLQEFVTVKYQTNQGTALANKDYLPITTLPTLVFRPRQTVQSFVVQILDDALNEDIESLSLFLSQASSNVDLGSRSSATLQILDDDPLPQVSLSRPLVQIPEGASEPFTLQLNTPSGRSVGVWYRTVDGTARSGAPFLDFEPITATVPAVLPQPNYGYREFSPGQITQTFTLTTTNDPRDETDTERLQVEIIGRANVATGTLNAAQVDILDNDAPPQLTINNVTVPNERAGVARFTAGLSAVSERPVLVNFATAPDLLGLHPATPNVDFVAAAGTVLFPPFPQIDLSRPISVTIIDDPFDEFDETFLLTLSGATNAAILLPQGVGTIADTATDDGPPALTLGDSSRVEGDSGAANLIFTATLSITSEKEITVTAATANGSATAPADYSPVSRILTFPPGSALQTLAVPINGDLLDEYPVEDFSVIVSNPNPPAASRVNIADGTGVGTIIDDDRADVQLGKTHAPQPVVAGTLVTYTLTVTNIGPTKATGLRMTDTLPAGFVPISVSSGCSSGGGTVTCNGGALPGPGSTVSVTVVAAVSASARGVLTNSAQASVIEPDPNPANNTASDPATVIASADLQLSKTHTPQPVIAGTLVTYTVAVVNNGPSSATNVQITDTLPAGWTPVSVSAGCSSGAGGITTCNAGTLAGPGSGFTATIVALVPANATGSFTSGAQASAAEPDPTPANNLNSDTVSLSALTDLAVGKTHTPQPVVAGTLVTYTLTAVNNGPSSATNVQLVDTLPAGWAAVSVSGGCTGTATVTCNAGTLASPGSRYTATLVAQVPRTARGNNPNTAQVSAAQPDPVAGNNQVSDPTTVVGRADVSAGVAHAPQPVVAGTLVTYTVAVTGAGPSSATTVQLVDTLPAGWTAVSVSAGCTGTATVTCNVGTLPGPGSSGTVTIVAQVPAGARGTPVNSVQVSAAETDPNPANNAASDPTAVVASADVQLSKTHTPQPVTAGSPVTYNLTALSNGPSSATSVQIVDTLPAGWTFVSAGPGCANVAGTVTCNVGTLAGPGSSATVSIVAQIPANAVGIFSPGAQVSAGEPDPVPANNAVTDPTTVTASADVYITKAHTPAVAGTPVTYTVRAFNNGPSQASSLRITDTLPAGWPVVSVSPGCTNAAGTVTCNVGPLPGAGSSWTISIVAQIPANASGTFTPGAQVSAAEPDPVPANNVVTDPTVVAAQVDLAVSLRAVPNPVQVGSPLAYTIAVTNNGPSLATGVSVADTLPAGTGLPAVTVGGSAVCTPAVGSVNCSVAGLAPGAAELVTVTVTPTVSGALLNSVSVLAAQPDVGPGPNSAQSIVTSLGPPASVLISGPVQAPVNVAHTFTATVSPPETLLPLTITWQATGQPPVARLAASLTDVISFTWATIGPKIITVTAANALGSTVATHTVSLSTSLVIFGASLPPGGHQLYLPLVVK